jgi:hypothetical protein
MGKATVHITSEAERERAASYVAKAPLQTAVTFQRDVRTIDQNSMLWPLLTTISREVEWYGRKLSPHDWKNMFTAALRGYDAVPGIDGKHTVVLGQSTSRMSKEQFSDLIEIILAFGAGHGVDLTDPREGKEVS